MNLSEWLMRAAKRTPNAPALLVGAEVVCNYAEFAQRSMGLAAALQQRFGVRPDDRIALFLANRVEYLELFYATWLVGAVVVPINFKLHPREAAWIIGNAEAKVVFADDDCAAALAPLLAGLPEIRSVVSVDTAEFADLKEHDSIAGPVPRQDKDIAWLFYTSGTTGKPKGVMLSNGNLQAMSLSYFVDVDAVLPGDSALYAAPFSHGAGLYNFMHVMRGVRHVIPVSQGFDPAEVLELSTKLGSTSMFAAPTMVKRLIDRAKATGSNGNGIRTIVYGGGPMYIADIEEAVAVMGPRFIQIYGQGESPMTITALQREIVADRTHPRWRQRLGSVGCAQSTVEVQIADAERRPLKLGETGEIWVRGTPVMLGYWRNTTATSETIRDGWLRTGDVGVFDEDGFLTLKDRSKDVIISGGTNIYPREVEETLLLYDKIAEVSVLGQPSAEWGEDVVAFVVAKPGTSIDAKELDAHCLQHIARFKRPKAYHMVDDLPKNNYGKVLKTELRARLQAINNDKQINI